MLSNGEHVDATPDHRFLVYGKGFLPLTDIHTGDILVYGGKNHGSDGDLTNNSRIQWDPFLQVWELLPSEGEASSSCGVVVSPWGNPEETPCPPYQRGPGGQPIGEPEIDAWARAFVGTHDRGAPGVVEEEHREGEGEGVGVARIGRRDCLAPGKREGIFDASTGCAAGATVETVPMYDVFGDCNGEAEGIVFLHSCLQNDGSWHGGYGVIVAGFGPETSSPVYDVEVDDAHCFLTGAGVYAHNCVDTVLYLLSKNPKDHVKASKLFELNNSNVGAYSEMGVW